VVEERRELAQRQAGGVAHRQTPRRVRVWLKLATGFALAPLRPATWLEFGVSAFGLLLAVLLAIRRLLDSGAPVGWASTIVTMLVLGGAQLACPGVIGKDPGRTYLRVSGRPPYAVRETVGRQDALARTETDRTARTTSGQTGHGGTM
jgi:polyisoprenyl-phosphate glycosyltransferase